MKKVVVIHSIGKDRPGIVADVTRIVTDKGGNVGESRAQLLGGHFSLMMLVEIAEKEVETLEDELVSGVPGMKTECLESVDQKNATVAPTIACELKFVTLYVVSDHHRPFFNHISFHVLQKNSTTTTKPVAGRFKLSGADNPGIVHKLTSVLARNSLTIGNMRTEHEEAPFGGTELFTMEGRAVAYEPLASNFEWEKIREELISLGESLNCDIEFDDITGHSIRH